MEHWFGLTTRFDVTKEFLRGHGIEIGAGATPQRLPDETTASYFDKRSAGELEALFGAKISYKVNDAALIGSMFPDGADFFIAHQVLEHIHQHIPALAEWNSRLKDGGVMVLSVPDCDGLIYDKPRPRTSFEHLAHDFGMQRDESHFETKEHIGSFCLGWSSSWDYLDRDQFAANALAHTYRDDNDLHWHANNRETWDHVVSCALLHARLGGTILRIADKNSPPPFTTQGEIIYVYRVERSSRTISGLPDVRDRLIDIANKLNDASWRIRALAE